jgi:hypothetical protein
MSLPLLIAVGIILTAGAVGGVFNSIIIDQGFKVGGKEIKDGKFVWKLGFSSNIMCGAFAAFISWGLYGPLSSADLFKENVAELTFSTICGAALIGFSGSSWLTTQSDKSVWKTTAIEATKAQPSPGTAAEIATQTPQQALRTVKNLPV